MADRRTVLKAGAALGGLAAFATGYSKTAERVVHGVADSLAPKARAGDIHGRSLAPECTVDPVSGAVTLNPDQQISYTLCLGCTTLCGVRVRVDKKTGKVLRVSGNPYSPLSTDPALPYETPIAESFAAVSMHGEKGLGGRSTACGRGAAALSQMESPFRITTPLKRVGPRNSGRWQPIPFEQLVREVAEGGDLFGEGHVKGLRELRSFDPIDPAKPDLGPRVNQVAILASVNDGREAFARRFMQKAYGTINYVGHGGYCGGSYRSGSGASFGNLRTMPHAKPDFANAGFVMFCGTAPANAGNPFKRQGWQLAEGRSGGRLRYAVVDPVLGHSDSLAARDKGRWIPIRPATDGALAMALIRWIIENERYDGRNLAQPNAKLAEAIGEASFTNATHLVVVEPGHPREGTFLRASDLGLAIEGEKHKDKDPFVVADSSTGELGPHATASGPAVLFVDRTIELDGKPARVRSSLDLLKESAFAKTVEEYSAICGVPADTIVSLARELTSHGKKASVNAHGGTMAGNGFYSAFALVTINALLGNLNVKGGTLTGGGAFKDAAAGPRYDLEKFEGMVSFKGLTLSRNNQPYERSSEFKAKKAAGKPYPAERPWFFAAPQLGSEWLPAAADGYPYPLKALILWSTNPVYGVPGVRPVAEKALGDRAKIPLIVAIDPVINETSAYADYIVPDSLLYESWGWAAPWGGVATKVSTGRWPVVEPKADKAPDGEPIGMETFFIALAKAMSLPGFGAAAGKDASGQPWALERPADWYLRGGANIAFAGKPVQDASDEDMAATGLDRIRSTLTATLKEDEWRKVAYVLARGGRYQNVSESYQGDKIAGRKPMMLNLYNEAVAATRNALTGKRFSGVPIWAEPSFADGTPMRQLYPAADWPLLLVSQKGVLLNSYAIGIDRLRGLKPDNPVAIHPDDAAAHRIRTGDRIRITTPGGAREATAIVRHGVVRGTIAIEHGYGHRELGARAHAVGGRKQPVRPELAAGINLNDLGLSDPTRVGASVWLDPVCGSAVRNGLPARVARSAASA